MIEDMSKEYLEEKIVEERKKWERLLNRVKVKKKDKELEMMVNGWMKYKEVE